MDKTFEGLLQEIIKITTGNLNFLHRLKPGISKVNPLYKEEIEYIQNYINGLDWLMEYNEKFVRKSEGIGEE